MRGLWLLAVLAIATVAATCATAPAYPGDIAGFTGAVESAPPTASAPGAQSSPAAPVKPAPCSYALSVWTPDQHATGASQWIQPAARSEGICNLKLGVRAWGRLDLEALPGKAAPTSPSLDNVGAVDSWAGVSKPVLGPLSIAAFVGAQRAIPTGAKLGLGGITESLGAGIRIDYAGGFAVGGILSRYAPAEATRKNAGPAVGATIVLPIHGVVGIAANAAYVLRTGDRIYSAGPTAGWGK